MRTPHHRLVLTLSVACAGCSVEIREENPGELGTVAPAPETGSTTQSAGETDSSNSGGSSETDHTSLGDDGSESPTLFDVAPNDGSVELAEVFGHSGTTLYRLEPDTLDLVPVGTFTGCEGSVIDIALDEGSAMFGVTYRSLYAIDRLTATCTHIADGHYPTSLSFVPAGTLAPESETLVGFVDGQYVEIDVLDGTVSPLGSLSDGLSSSGDVVSVKGGGTYLTVFGPGCGDRDCIIKFDPQTGAIVENYGPLPYDEVFGLAFWAGTAYGFARGGEVFAVEFMPGGVSTRLIPVPNAPYGLEFFGAGSTTSAPPVAG